VKRCCQDESSGNATGDERDLRNHFSAPPRKQDHSALGEAWQGRSQAISSHGALHSGRLNPDDLANYEIVMSAADIRRQPEVEGKGERAKAAPVGLLIACLAGAAAVAPSAEMGTVARKVPVYVRPFPLRLHFPSARDRAQRFCFGEMQD
jgi:hypothetical protein